MSIFRKPSKAKIGLKVLAYGDSSVGKSTFGLSFPKIAAVDSEAGLSRYEDPTGTTKAHKLAKENLLQIVNTSSIDDTEIAIGEVDDMADEGVIGTFLIDSETKLYDSMQVASMDVEERRARRKGKDVDDTGISVKSWGRIKILNKKMQSLKIDLSSKGINVISIGQMEDIKEKKGETFVKVGDKPSMAKGVQYDYDIIIKLEWSKKDGFTGIIEKDRTGVTQRGDVVSNPSYDIWKKHCEKSEKLESRPTNFVKDVDKDVVAIESEDDKLAELREEFKTKMKALDSKDQPKVVKEAKKLGINNPLKSNDIKGLTKVVEFINGLE